MLKLFAIIPTASCGSAVPHFPYLRFNFSMASFMQKNKVGLAFDKCAANFKHGFSDKLIDEVTAIRPNGACKAACLRAWLQIEKVANV